MADKLQDIEKQIQQAKQTREKVTRSLEDLGAQKSLKRSEHQTMILEDKDTGAVANNLLTMQIQEQGFREALAAIDDNLSRLESEKENEVFNQFVMSYKNKLRGVIGISDKAYTLLQNDLLSTISEARRAALECRAFMGSGSRPMAGSDDDHLLGLIDNNLHHMETEVKRILNELPKSAISDRSKGL
ncbi:MAG TPA: hypothetical protein VGK00_03230 [Anaerolineales bacterium]|jgi:hypothetical protein